MAVQKIIQIGNPALLNLSIDVQNIYSEQIQNIIQDLTDTHSNSKSGIGIAAPQIGENFRIFITEIPTTPTRSAKDSDEFRIYINPEIVEYSKEVTELYEGCLSVASGDFCLPVTRSKTITVDAFDPFGKKFRIRCNGLLARAIQHEYDHLQGILFIEKGIDFRRATDLEHYRQINSSNKEMIEARKITLKEITYF